MSKKEKGWKASVEKDAWREDRKPMRTSEKRLAYLRDYAKRKYYADIEAGRKRQRRYRLMSERRAIDNLFQGKRHKIVPRPCLARIWVDGEPRLEWMYAADYVAVACGIAPGTYREKMYWGWLPMCRWKVEADVEGNIGWWGFTRDEAEALMLMFKYRVKRARKPPHRVYKINWLGIRKEWRLMWAVLLPCGLWPETIGVEEDDAWR